jgi:hypothetical protein
LRPLAILGLGGVTWIDTSVAAVTVSPVLPEIAPLVAVMVVPPCATELARPCEPLALLMVAAVVSLEAQVTWVVRFWVVLSV